MKIVTDEDLAAVPVSLLVKAITDFVVADFNGKTITPPRHAVSFPQGRLVFTTGGSETLAGFRAYETFQSSSREATDQIVAVWDLNSCALKGVCLGTRLGALRTGALGGIAVNALVDKSASACAIIGTGLQAETQLLAILSQRELSDVRVFSRQESNRIKFAARFQDKARVTLFDNPEEAVAGAKIVILATSSVEPVVKPEWLQEAVHITTVGPKFIGAHELPLELIDGEFLLVSDSPQQIQSQGESHMLYAHSRLGDVLHLGEVIAHGRPTQLKRSLFLSAGLSGTEVIALDAVVSYLGK